MAQANPADPYDPYNPTPTDPTAPPPVVPPIKTKAKPPTDNYEFGIGAPLEANAGTLDTPFADAGESPFNTGPATDWWKTQLDQWTAEDPSWVNPVGPNGTALEINPQQAANTLPGASAPTTTPGYGGDLIDRPTTATTTPGALIQGQGTPTYFGGEGTLAGYTGDTKPVDPAQWTSFTQDLGVGQDKGDHAQVKTLANRLQQAGYQVALGPTDQADQLDSLYINGQLVRVFDSSGRWTYDPDTPDNPAWDMPESNAGESTAPGHAPLGTAAGHTGPGGQTLPGAPGPILTTETPAPTTGAPNTNTNPMGGQAQSLYDLLMSRATQSLNVNPNDPIIKGQTDAFDASQQRAARNYLQGVAEKVGSNANITGETRASSEQIGINDAQYQAQLIGQELTARRQEIQQALSGAAGLLTEQQRMALQKELSLIQMAQQDRQFNQSLRQSAEQFAASLGYNYASLSQADRQFLASLQQRGYEFDQNDRFRNSPLGS